MQKLQQSNPQANIQAVEVSRGVLSYLFLLVALAGGGFIIFGAMKMRQMRSWGLALAASIVAMIPYLSPSCGCCFGIPIGIWAIVVLCSQDVKAAFR